jgi:predicted N-acetyltransferase YhbS
MEKQQNSGFRVRPFQRDDAPGVRRVLEATYGGEATPAEVYDWWSFGCPCASSGFMVAESNGSVVGVQPLEIFPYHDGQKSFKGGMLTGVAVHPEFRRCGIFSALVKACEQEAWRQGAAFVSTMPNDRSRPGFLKLGYTDLGRRKLLVRLVNPGDMGARSVPWLGRLIGGAAGCIQAAVKPTSAEEGLSLTEIKSISPEVADLALQHETLFPGLRIRRSAEWWRWRFLEAPTRRYRILEARASDGKLAGLGVYTTGWKGRHKVSYLVDLVVGGERAARAIVNRLCEYAATEGSHAFAAVVSSKSLANALNRAGLWSVPAWAPIKRFYSVVRFNPASDIPRTWYNLDGWYQTFADWDNL